MGGRGNAGLAAVWRGRIAEQRRSGLSIAEFCRLQGCSAPSFYVWRKRLRSGRSGAVGASGAVDARGGRPTPALFVPLTLGPADCQGVRIELPGGAVVSLPADASAELVTTAIQAVLSARTQEQPAC